MSEVQLFLGDCLEILPTLADNSVDAVITDVPYGTTACKWDEVIPFEPMWKQMKRITSIFITTSNQPFTSRLIISNLTDFKYCLIWDKIIPSGFLYAKYRPMNQTEDICIFAKDKTTFNPQPIFRNKPILSGKGKNLETANFIKNINHHKRYTEKHPVSLLSFMKERGNSVHPTQKPVALYEYLIRTYTNKGDTVADICMGSGTTGVACAKTGRNFIGIEIEPKYFEIAEKRIKEAQMQLRMPF